jgi:predicted ATPase
MHLGRDLEGCPGGRMMAMLRRIMLKGYKSIREMDLELRPLNVMIGTNGAGKSNLISFFRMLNDLLQNRRQDHVAILNDAQSLLHFGPEVTPQIEARLEFETADENRQKCIYYIRLSHELGHAPPFDDRLLLAEERIGFHQASGGEDPQNLSLAADLEESHVLDQAYRIETTTMLLRQLLDGCRVYHFHDAQSAVGIWHHDNIFRALEPNGRNLASFLYQLKNRDTALVYQRIVRTIRLMAPFFHDFEFDLLGPNASSIVLNWRDKESGQVLDARQLSDGTLRAICLITLLLQPEEHLPDLIIVDEPELGLHPYAVNLVAALIKTAAHRTQVLISTQSSSFLDYFDPEDIIVVDREGKESVFRRPDPIALEAWLDEYSLGEVWEKNVIGGGPH